VEPLPSSAWVTSHRRPTITFPKIQTNMAPNTPPITPAPMGDDPTYCKSECHRGVGRGWCGGTEEGVEGELGPDPGLAGQLSGEDVGAAGEHSIGDRGHHGAVERVEVVAHREVGRCDLNAEQHSWTRGEDTKLVGACAACVVSCCVVCELEGTSDGHVHISRNAHAATHSQHHFVHRFALHKEKASGV